MSLLGRHPGPLDDQDERARTEGIGDRLAESLGAVDHDSRLRSAWVLPR